MPHDVPVFSVIFLVCGLLGGIARIFFDRKIRPKQAVGYVVVGAIAGNFFVKPIFLFVAALAHFGPQLLDLINSFPPEVAALVIGFGGIDYFNFCRWLNKRFLGELKQIGRTKNE